MLRAPEFQQGASRVSFDHRLIEEAFQLQNTQVSTDAQLAVIQRKRDGQIVPEIVITSKKEKRVIHITRNAKSSTGWQCENSPEDRTPGIPQWLSFAPFLAGKDRSAAAPLFCLVQESAQGNYRLLEKNADKPWARRSDSDAREVLRNAIGINSFAVHHDVQDQVFLTGSVFKGVTADFILLHPLGDTPFPTEPEAERRLAWTRHTLLSNRPITEYYPCIVDLGLEGELVSVSVMELNGSDNGELLRFRFSQQLNPDEPRHPTGNAQLRFSDQSGKEVKAKQLIPLRLKTELRRRDCVGLDTNGAVYYVNGGDSKWGRWQRLGDAETGPRNVRQLSVTTDTEGRCTFFALDNSRSLWVIRESGRSDQGLTFAKWQPLGVQFGQIAVASRSSDQLELFGVTIDEFFLIHMHQDPINGTWFTDKIELPMPPTTKTINLAAWVSDITITNEKGLPVGKQLIEVSATRSTDLFVDVYNKDTGLKNRRAFHVNPTTPALCHTDALGKVRVSAAALNLTAPTLKVHIANASLMSTDQGIAIRPDVHAHERLAGGNKEHAVTGAALIKNGLLAGKYEKDADEIAKSIQQVGKLMLKEGDRENGKNALKSRAWAQDTPYFKGLEFIQSKLSDYQCEPDYSHADRNTPFTLTFGSANRVTYETLTAEAADALFSEAIPVLSLWDSIGDFLRWCKQTVDKVVGFVVQAAQDVYKLAVKIGTELFEFVAKTVQQIADYTEVLFHKVAAAAKEAMSKVINWLKELFGWDDILNTKAVLRHFIEGSLKNLNTDATTLLKVIDKKVKEGEELVALTFGDLKSKLERIPNLTALVAQSDKRPDPRIGNSFLKPNVLQQTLAGNQVRCSFLDSALSTAPAPPPPALVLDDETQALIKELMSVATTIANSITRQVENLTKLLKAVGEHPDKVVELGLVAFLNALEELFKVIIRLAGKFASILVRTFQAMMKVVNDLMTAEINIPVISQLYFDMTGERLTALDFGCLLMAAPLTILYKAVRFGGTVGGHPAPPFTRDSRNRFCDAPIPWLKLDSNGNFVRQPASEAAPLEKEFGIMGGLGTLIGIPISFLVDVDAKNHVDPDGPVSVWAKPLGLASWIQQLCVQVCGFPFSTEQSSDVYSAVNWGLNWVALMFDLTALGFTPFSGRARQSGAVALWTHSTVTVMRGLFASAPLALAQLREQEWIGAAGSFCQLIRPVCGYLIVGKVDAYWIAFGSSQIVSAVGDVGAGGIQIYKAFKDSDEFGSPIQIAHA